MAQKEIQSLCGGALLLSKDKTQETSTVPVYCACCRFPMITMEDSLSFRKVGVCSKCDGQWTNFPGVDWSIPGRGPKKDSLEWAEYMEIRALYAKPILKLR